MMKKLHISKKFLIGFGALLLTVSLIATGSVIAKYVLTVKNETSAVTAKAFYFESDYLTEDNHTYKLNAGTRSISFVLSNYENALRISGVDCVYTVTVTSSDTAFTVNGENATEERISAPKDVKTDEKITLDNLKDGCEYRVTVTADGGYVKTLSATFVIAPSQSGIFMNVNNTDAHYVTLTVWTQNVYGEIDVSVPAGLIPDATDPILATVQNYKNGTYESFSFKDAESFAAAYSSRSYRFFKTAAYSSGNFAVKTEETDAVESNIP